MQSIAEHLSPEARQWLRMNPNPHGFATNRFGTTENALDFEEEGPGDVPPGDFTVHTRRDHIRLWWD